MDLKTDTGGYIVGAAGQQKTGYNDTGQYSKEWIYKKGQVRYARRRK